MERQELLEFLDRHGVRHQDFGIGHSKRVDDLLEEIRKGDIRLIYRKRDRRVVRKARTLRFLITIRNPETGEQLVLRERGLSYPQDLRMRHRPFDYGASLSETIPKGKRILSWAAEALVQELLIRRLPQRLFKPWRPSERKSYESSAYPGIISDVRYVFLKIELPHDLYQPMYFHTENDIFSLFDWESYLEHEPQEERVPPPRP